MLALYRGVIPPNVNMRGPDDVDPACALRFTMGSAVEGRFRTALVQALGFGNTDCCCILQAV